MFDPNSLAGRKATEKRRKIAIKDLTLWGMELVPEDLQEGLSIDVMDVQCGDPNCAPVDTLFTLLWSDGEGKGRFGVPAAPEELTCKDMLSEHFPDEESLRAWRVGKLSEEEQKRQDKARAGAIRQACLDQIHHYSLWADAIVHHSNTSKLSKKVCISMLKNLAETSTSLFSSSGAKAQALMEEDLKLASQVLAKICDKDSLQEVCEKFSLDRDECAPMKMWSDKVTSELKEVYSCPRLSPQKREMLRTTLSYIRQVEKSYEFQQCLYDEKEKTVKTHGVPSKEALTYGSTSFSLWKDVLELPSVRAVLETREGKKGPKVAILGSSQGLLCLYTDALCNSFVENSDERVCISGWEIIPCLHEIADDIMRNVSTELSHIQVHLQDMLRADLSDFDVVVLTSLCWDSHTRLKIAKKLSQDLRRGSLVLDYREDTFSQFGLDDTSSLYSQPKGGNEVEGGEEEYSKSKEYVAIQEASTDHLLKALDDGLADAIEAFWRGEEYCVPVTPPRAKAKAKGTRTKFEDEKEGGKFRLEGLTEGSCSWSNQQGIYVHIME